MTFRSLTKLEALAVSRLVDCIQELIEEVAAVP